MADIVSNLQKINDVEVGSDAPVSETLMSKLGASINSLIDYTNIKTCVRFIANSQSLPGGTTVVLDMTVTLAAHDTLRLILSGYPTSGFTLTNFVVNGTNASMSLDRNGSLIMNENLGAVTVSHSGVYLDSPGAGTYRYKLNVGASSDTNVTGTATFQILRCL